MSLTNFFKAEGPGVGIITDSTDIQFLEQAAMSGVQYIVFDDEHREGSADTKEKFLYAVQGKGLPAIIRIPEFQIDAIPRVLDCGWDGIIVPHVEDAAALDRVMNNVYFPPKGMRGIGQCKGNKFYSEYDTAGYVELVNNNDWIIAQIESPKGVEHAEEIVSHAGVAAIMVGPRDLSTEMGKPGNFFDEEVQAKIAIVRDACKKYNKALLMPCQPAAFSNYRERGINNFMVATLPLCFNAMKNAAKAAME